MRDKWTLCDLKGVSTEDFCTWDNIHGIVYDGDAYLVMNKCVDLKKELWFESGKCM